MCNWIPRKRKGGGGKVFEEIVANFYPNFLKTVNSQIQENQQTSNTRHIKKTNL